MLLAHLRHAFGRLFYSGLFLILLLAVLLLAMESNTSRLARELGLLTSQISAIEAQYGLSQTFPQKIIYFSSNYISGDFGVSLVTRRPISELIIEQFPVTLALVIVSSSISTPLALYFSKKIAQHRSRSELFLAMARLGTSTSIFLIAFALILFFAVNLRWLPAGGLHSLDLANPEGLIGLILPSITIVLSTLGSLVSIGFVELVKTDNNPDVRQGSCLPKQFVIVFGHATRLSLGASIVVEIVFFLPGIGRLFTDAIESSDTQVLLAITMIIASTLVAFSLIIELLCFAIAAISQFAGWWRFR